MRQTSIWLLVSLALTAACGTRTTLDGWQDGVPSYVLEGPTPATPDTERDSGTAPTADASTEAGTGGAAVGDPCSVDGDCAGEPGSCLQSVTFGGFAQVDFPGGYCTLTGCQDDADCPDGSACFTATGMPGCNKLCESDADCRKDEGYTCAAVPLPFASDNRTFCQPPFDLGGLGL